MGIGKDFLQTIRATSTDVQLGFNVPLPGVVNRNLPLLEGANQNMNVDGGAATKDYKHIIPVGDLIFVHSVPLVLVDAAATLSPGNFGGIAALLNGLELIVVQDTVEKLICRIKTNKDLATCFFGGQLGTGLAAASGFLDTADFAMGQFKFDTPIILDGSKSDTILMRVQDDLLLLSDLEASIQFTSIPL